MTPRDSVHVLQSDCAVSVEDGTVRRIRDCIAAENRGRSFWGTQVHERHRLGNKQPWDSILLRGLAEEVALETARTPQEDLWQE